MKFYEYLAKQMVGTSFINSLERIATALEVLAGTDIKEKMNEEMQITEVELTEEEVYQQEQDEVKQSIDNKMERNEMRSPWAEDNLSADELESIG